MVRNPSSKWHIGFGIKQNGDESYELYTRGVDRFKSNVIENVLALTSNSFKGADLLWELIQENVEQFIQDNGSNASILSPDIERPDWELVKDVLTGVKPISSLGCH